MGGKTLSQRDKINSDDYNLVDFIKLPDRNLFAKTIPCYDFIEDLKKKGGYAHRRELLTACKNRVVAYDELTGKPRVMIMMASNNYLGLSTHPKVVRAGIDAFNKYGSGVGGSPLLNGTYDLLRELEEKIARLKGCEDAMLFTTGYSANLGIISGLIRSGDVILIDRLDHASIIDGCRLAGGNFRIFKHNNTEDLERQLKKCDKDFMGKLIVVDGIFSMDGNLANLPEIVRLAAQYEAKVMVDDAHAVGVVGEHGGGTLEHFELKGKVDIAMGTLSKAIGSTGGFAASSKEVINYLRHNSRSYIFSTSIAPPVVASALAALEIMEEEPQWQNKLWDNIYYMHDRLKALGYKVIPSPPESAIILLLINDEVKLRQMSKKIHQSGIYLNAVAYPAVPREKCRFRISLMATHNKDDLKATLDVLEKVGKEFGVI